jgi:hypothetical protein
LRWPPLVLGPVWLAALVTVGVLAWGVWVWLGSRRLPAEDRLRWELSTATLVALIVLPQTNVYTLVASLLPAWVVLWAGGERWQSWLPVLVVLALPWGFFFTGGLLPTGLEQFVIPLALGVLLTLRWRARRGRAG